MSRLLAEMKIGGVTSVTIGDDLTERMASTGLAARFNWNIHTQVLTLWADEPNIDDHTITPVKSQYTNAINAVGDRRMELYSTMPIDSSKLITNEAAVATSVAPPDVFPASSTPYTVEELPSTTPVPTPNRASTA